MVEKVMKELEERTGTTVTLSEEGNQFLFKKGDDNFVLRIMFDEDSIGKEDFVDEVAKAYTNAYENRPEMLKNNFDLVKSKEFILENVVPCVVGKNYLTYHEKLKGVKDAWYFEDFLDLKVVYRVVLHDSHSYLVSRNLLEVADLDPDELRKAALENVNKKSKCEFIEDFFEVDKSGKPKMVVVTTKDNYYGSALMLDPQNMEKVCAMLDCDDVQIIPSSVHALMVIPYKFRIPDEIVKLVNVKSVKSEEQLSDHTYRYSSGEFSFEEEGGEEE